MRPSILIHHRRSWAAWFQERVRYTRFVAYYHNMPHVQHEWAARAWAKVLPRLRLADLSNRPADWLNADAIAYRKALGRKTIEMGHSPLASQEGAE